MQNKSFKLFEIFLCDSEIKQYKTNSAKKV